jgi:hypothetical protein
MRYSKYHSKTIQVNGIRFDSKKEARRYEELKLLERAGEIQNLELQPEFELQPKFRKNGVTYRPIKYRADFKYTDHGKIVIEDVKGMKTDVYKIKKKLFEYRYPDLTIKEV